MRRHAVRSFVIVLAVGVGLVGRGLAADATRVKTASGKVEGALTADGKVAAFKGMPYALAPVGERRWKEPGAPQRWKGVRAAKEYGSHCMQQGGFPDMVFHDPGPSEDCLTLNVWTPVGAKKGSLPVMVWIYGGGFGTGSTSENRQDGQFLTRRGVVVVSMNYRLGIFGFYVHPELTAESPHHASGNYGLMDQAAALAWVKRNIASFGGDPRNVTIFGESAGSFAVSTLMASPLSKDLMTKAIGESGGAFYSKSLGYPTRARREGTDSAFAQAAFGTTKLADLRKLSADDLTKAALSKTAPPMERFGPDIDGYLLPESVAAIYAAGQQAHIPLLAGWNADEGRGEVIFAREKMTAAGLHALAAKEFGRRAAEFEALYPATTDAEAGDAASDYAGDRFIAFSTWRWMEAHGASGGSPIYRYRLDLGSPGDKNHPAAMGAFHSDDIEYIFGTLESRPGVVLREEDRALSEQMGAYWANFARTGNPNGPGLPQWPQYRAADGWPLMHLNAVSAASEDKTRERYLFLDSVWGAKKTE